MALVVKIDNYDISNLVQAAVEEFDPANAFNEPQFAGNSLTDGDLFISMTRRNREWNMPLLLIESSNDNLAATVRTINSHLKQGVTLEYREDGASNSTYFDVESATLEADYRYQRNRQGIGKFLLRVWTRPLGHTGTVRVVATANGTNYAHFPVASMGLIGDAPAILSLTASQVTPTSAYDSSNFQHLLAYGYTPRSDHITAHFPGSTLLGLSGDNVSGYHADVAAPLGTSIGLDTDQDYYGAAHITGAGASEGYAPTAITAVPMRLFVEMRIDGRASGFGSDSLVAPSTFPAIARSSVRTSASEAIFSSGAGGVDGQWVKIRSYPSSGFAPGGATRMHLYDLGVVDLRPTPGGVRKKLRIEVIATNLATAMASSFVKIGAAYTVPVDGYLGAASVTSMGGGASLVSNSIQMFQVAGASGFAAASHPLLPEFRGIMPAVDVVNPTGVLVAFFSKRVAAPLATQAFFRRSDLTVAAREQFQFFR